MEESHPNKLNLQIKCVNNDVEEMYKNHNFYHEGDAGLDLFCIQDQTINPGLSYKIKFGIKCQMEDEYYQMTDDEIIIIKKKYHSYLLVPRSSISETPLRMSNSIGIIDSGYIGEIMAMVDNHSNEDYEIKKGDRLFQIILPNLNEFSISIVDELRKTDRNEGGFGSTNK